VFVISNAVAAEFPLSWWPSFGYDSQKNAVCPWQFAPPIDVERKWDIKLEAGVWSQPIATGDKIYFLTDLPTGKEKGEIKTFGLGKNLSLEFRSNSVPIIDSAGLNKYDRPMTTPSLVMSNDGETYLIFGDGQGNIQYYRNEKQVPNFGCDLQSGCSSPITVFDGRIYVSTDSNKTFIINAANPSRSCPVVVTTRMVTVAPTVWGDYVMFGDNSGKFYVCNRINAEIIKQIQIDGTNAIRSTACIAELDGRTYAVFGSDQGRLNRLRLDDGSWELKSFVLPGQNKPEFWATPTCIDGMVYIGNENGTFYKIDLDRMSVVATMKLDYSIFSQAVANNGFMYVTTANKINDSTKFEGSLYIIDLSTFKSFADGGPERIEGGSYVSPIFAGNRLFVASRSGRIHCFKGMQPDVKVQPDRLDFTSIGFDSNSVDPITFTVSNTTRYTNIVGTVKTEPDNDWLKVSKKQLDGNNTQITASVDVSKLKKRTDPLTGNIQIEYIYGLETSTIDVPVNVSFEPTPPKFMLNRNEIIMRSKASDTQRIVTDSIKVSLRQSETVSPLNFEISTKDDWYEFDKKLFTLGDKPGNTETTISIRSDAKKLLDKNPNKYDYEGEFTISGIVRNKPYSPITVKIKLTIEKEHTLIAIPTISETDRDFSKKIDNYEPEYTETIPFVFTNSSHSGEMKIEKKPVVTYLPGDVKDWIKLPKLPLSQSDFTINFQVEVLAKDFKPNMTYKATIPVTFNTGAVINLEITYETLSPESVGIKFIIGSKNYWVNSILQPDTMSAAPYISSKGNTMVPIRPISNPLAYYYGAQLEWMKDIQTVLFSMGGKSLRLVIGHNKAYIDNEDGSISEVALNSPPEIRKGMTFIPPRIVADTFGGRSSWDSSTRTVVFTFPKPR
jgi:outer membrane protein assembly factor BamB